MLDIEESMLDAAMRSREELSGGVGEAEGSRTADLCADLAEFSVLSRQSPTAARQCERCLAEGTAWVALRECLACGNVGCCDSSPGAHATAHFRESSHPVMQTAEPGEDWRWCYVHHLTA